MAWKDKDRSVGKTEVPNRPRNVDIRSAAQRDRYLCVWARTEESDRSTIEKYYPKNVCFRKEN